VPELGKAIYTVGADIAPFEAGMAATEASAAKTAAKVDKTLASMGASMGHLGHTLSRRITLPVLAVGAASVKMGMDFEKNMRMLQTQAGASAGEVTKMSKAILGMKGLEEGPNELAKALYHIESVGIRGAKALDILKQAAHGAAVGGADLEAVTNALAGAVKTGIRGTEDFEKTMGTLNATIGAGNMRMDDLTAAVSTGFLTAGKGAGLSLKEMGAALAVFTQRAVPAQVAAQRIRMGIAFMTPSNKGAIESFKKMGIGQYDLAKAMNGPGGLGAALKILRNAYDATAS